MRAPDIVKRYETWLFGALLLIGAVVLMPRGASASVPQGARDAAGELRTIAQTLERFRASRGYFPPDSVVGRMPPETRAFFAGEDPFAGLTPVGGQYDYQCPQGAGPVCIAIVGSSFIEPPGVEDAMALDEIIDDGDLHRGNFRVTDGGYAYAFGRRE